MQKITFVFTLYITVFLNTARNPDKSYKINFVLYFGLNMNQSWK